MLRTDEALYLQVWRRPLFFGDAVAGRHDPGACVKHAGVRSSSLSCWTSAARRRQPAGASAGAGRGLADLIVLAPSPRGVLHTRRRFVGWYSCGLWSAAALGLMAWGSRRLPPSTLSNVNVVLVTKLEERERRT